MHENADLQNLCAHAVFRKGRDLENLRKFEQNSIQNKSEKRIGKQNQKYQFWARFWEGFGRGLGGFGGYKSKITKA